MSENQFCCCFWLVTISIVLYIGGYYVYWQKDGHSTYPDSFWSILTYSEPNFIVTDEHYIKLHGHKHPYLFKNGDMVHHRLGKQGLVVSRKKVVVGADVVNMYKVKFLVQGNDTAAGDIISKRHWQPTVLSVEQIAEYELEEK